MILKLCMLVSCAVLTMTAQEAAQPNMEGFKYPVLARAARIQGSVEFMVKSDGVQLLSGHPMLAAAAKSNLERWAVPYAFRTPLSATYVFRLKEHATQIVEVDEPITGSFDRFFLRLFRRPLTRKIKQQNCIDSNESSIGLKNLKKDSLRSIEIDIEAVVLCVQTDVLAIAALRQ